MRGRARHHARTGRRQIGQAEIFAGFIGRGKLIGERPVCGQEEADARAQNTAEQ